MPKQKSHAFPLLAGLFVGAANLSAQTTRPEAEKNFARDIYKEFVEIQSGYTTGSTTPVAEAAAARLRAAGFSGSDIFVGGADPKKANLVVRYRGTGARKPILLLAHTDVVEAKREDWSMDPFQFVGHHLLQRALDVIDGVVRQDAAVDGGGRKLRQGIPGFFHRPR